MAVVKPPYPLLAVSDPSIVGHSLYKEMDDTDLSECIKFNSVRVCPAVSSVSRSSKASCLYALYTVDKKNIQGMRSSMTDVVVSSHLVQLSNNDMVHKWSLFSKPIAS